MAQRVLYAAAHQSSIRWVCTGPTSRYAEGQPGERQTAVSVAQKTLGAARRTYRTLTIGAHGRGDREAVHPPCLGRLPLWGPPWGGLSRQEGLDFRHERLELAAVDV